MSSLIKKLTEIYPKQVFLEITPEDLEAASPNNSDYSYDVARHHALINRLLLNCFTNWLRKEAPIEEEFNIWPNVEDLPSIWEFVNGTALTIGHTRLALIPQETIDTDEFSVPQEWVDIPNWLADYYLGVQVNLEQRWLRIWGFISHKTLKQKAEYDPVLRNYLVPGELLIEDLTVMWVARQFQETERAEVSALPELFGHEFDRISEVLGKPRGYSPRLLVTNSEPIDDSEVAFPKWGALMSKHNLRQQLYSKLCSDHHDAQINSDRERLEKLLDVNWLEPEKILVSSGRIRRANANQLSKKEQSIQFNRGKIIELDNQRFVLMIEIKQGKENQDIKLSFKLIPHGADTTSLPSGLELALLNPSGKVVTSNTAKTGDNQLFIPPNPSKPATMDMEKLESNIKKGKVFQIKITLNGQSKTEPFPVS